MCSEFNIIREDSTDILIPKSLCRINSNSPYNSSTTLLSTPPNYKRSSNSLSPNTKKITCTFRLIDTGTGSTNPYQLSTKSYTVP